MTEMKNYAVVGLDGAGTLELAPYGKGTAWLEVNNTAYGGFIVMTPEIALELASKLTEWAAPILSNKDSIQS